MGDRFTYEFPTNFDSRMVQYLQQSRYGSLVAKAYQNCQYKYINKGNAYRAGIRGEDLWDRQAVEITFEGPKRDIDVLKNNKKLVEDSVSVCLDADTTGLLVLKLVFFENDLLIKQPLTRKEGVTPQSTKAVLQDLVDIGQALCCNSGYSVNSTENALNDFFRDMLTIKRCYEVKDQTRHGRSTSGKDAGEVDLLLTIGNKELACIEGLKLSSVDKQYIEQHIVKAVSNYNPLGTPTYIVAYVTAQDFDVFWDKYIKYINSFEFPSPYYVSRELRTSEPNVAAIRTADLYLSSDGYRFPVYFLAIHLMGPGINQTNSFW